MNLRWSARARQDLKEIGHYIARDNPKLPVAGLKNCVHVRKKQRTCRGLVGSYQNSVAKT